MKKLPIALGYFTFFFTALYAVFKFVRIPGAFVLMLIAGILIAIYFPLLFLKQFQMRYSKKLHLVHKFGAFLLSILILSVIFNFQHWNIVMYEDDQLILLFSIPPLIFNATYYCFSFIFIPMLIYVNYRDGKDSLIKNIVAGLGLSIISFSLIGYQLHSPYHHHLFIIGNILFVLIYLPWHLLSSLKKEPKEFHYTFQILIIGYILILFVYGIFIEWPVTYQDVLMNLK